MEDSGKRIDIQSLLSLGDDLIRVLQNKKDSDSLMQCVEGGKMVKSSCQADAHEVHISLEELHRKINACKENIDKTKSETIADEEVKHLQDELEDKLQQERSLRQEHRIVNDEIDGLERQRISIEERKELVKKTEKDLLRAQDILSMCASVTNIIPNLDGPTISGFIMDRSKKKAEKFELETSISPFEACNKLWKMAQL